MAGAQKILFIIIKKIGLEPAINGKNIACDDFGLIQPEKIKGISKKKFIGKILKIGNFKSKHRYLLWLENKFISIYHYKTNCLKRKEKTLFKHVVMC